MSPSIGVLFGVAVAYLALLFGVAYATERGLVPARLVRHPLTYAISLGVYATSWTYSGSVGFARSQGYAFLTIYLGVTLACLLVPVLWEPVLRLCREHQLTSLADLFAFRFQSQGAGVLVTVFMLAGNLPYLALQIHAVTAGFKVLAQASPPSGIALMFCGLVTLFALLFGARHVTPRERHAGLGVAIAFESLVKLVALLTLAAVAVSSVFGGLSGLSRWLAEHPQALEQAYGPVESGPWATLLLLSFAAAFLLPRQFHMAFTESLDGRALRVAAWAFPLFLLLLNLPVMPLLWSGMVRFPDGNPDNHVLALARSSGHPLVGALAFVGAISAASSMLIVDTLALAAMCLNHLVLPRTDLARSGDLYAGLLWARRALIVTVLALGYAFSRLLATRQGLVEIGLISFVAVAQVLPGLLALLFWRGATRAGFLVGLSAGVGVWALTLFLPLLARGRLLPAGFDLAWVFGIRPGTEPWSTSTFWSLFLNTLLFGGVSLLTRATAREEEAAVACTRGAAPGPWMLEPSSAQEFQARLAPLLGEDAASTELTQALADLDMVPGERRPAQLGRLRDRLQRNLSGLMGPLVARWVVDRSIRINHGKRAPLSDRIRALEEQLRASRAQLQGAPAELEAYRRYLRRVLEDLPLGVCALGPDRDVVIWNRALEHLSGLTAHDAVGARLDVLAGPLPASVRAFVSGVASQEEVRLQMGGASERAFSLSRSQVREPGGTTGETAGVVVLVEDLTERKLLAAQVAHQDRLASVGRLAAGVAHEIGNPLTGIACLAQNLVRELGEADLRDRVGLILRETQRIDAIVRVLLGYSHAGAADGMQRSPVDLQACVEEAITLVRLSREAKSVPCQNQVPDGVHVSGDRQRLIQVFVNLVSNACDASPPGTPVTVGAESTTQGVKVSVQDRGTGMDESTRERMFEPFYTTKPPGQGTGLGLPLVAAIVREHGGTLRVETRPGAGTTVEVELPGAEAPVAGTRVAEALGGARA
ncbi:MAG TPA: ATP-binding protein [Myxococcaceae bacterium]|nr:ATP-binding protein [Myxococcaceae bacterium]